MKESKGGSFHETPCIINMLILILIMVTGVTKRRQYCFCHDFFVSEHNKS